MAISNCKECDGKVSTLAKTCPHCGAPKPTHRNKKQSSVKASGLQLKKKRDINISSTMTICCSNVHCSVWADAVDVPKKPSLKNYKCPRCNSQMIEHNEEKIEEMARKARPWEIDQRLEKEQTETIPEKYIPPKPGDANYSQFLDGDVDLATAYWGYMFLGSIVVGFVAGFLTGMFGAFFSLALVFYSGWAAAGVWASAEKYKVKKIEQKQSVVWGVLAQIFSVVNVLGALSFVLQAFGG